MKTTLLKSSLFLFLFAISFSCSIQKRVHLKGYHITWNSQQKSVISDKKNAFQADEEMIASQTEELFFETSTEKPLAFLSNSKPVEINHFSTPNTRTIYPQKYQQADTTCDQITLKNGEEIDAQVLEISNENVKYKRCDNLEGPTYILEKNKIFMIKYKNGSKDVFQTLTEKKQLESIQKTPEKPIHPLATLSLILGIVGLIFGLFASLPAGIIFGLLALILGIIALELIKSDEKFRGKGLAITGIILGLIGMISFIYLFSIIIV